MSGPDDLVPEVLEGQSTRAALALVAEQPPDQAEVVTLRLLAGLEVAEMARIVGKRPGEGAGCWPIAAGGGSPGG